MVLDIFVFGLDEVEAGELSVSRHFVLRDIR